MYVVPGAHRRLIFQRRTPQLMYGRHGRWRRSQAQGDTSAETGVGRPAPRRVPLTSSAPTAAASSGITLAPSPSVVSSGRDAAAVEKTIEKDINAIERAVVKEEQVLFGTRK